ncbi:response regulator [Novosphingobium sediminicola]|uniref:DNA-binding NtrC family response regulator n=1 Tax=Novosphingobium sediminicola TaxID=563162 RepID=A0A7W6CSY6_9SPHN|nr:response regulator [Novosphingobium sediminicola]MBB3957247.1 DNA-binding NtrC family response regulator [Novosphingobium sediminicola]
MSLPKILVVEDDALLCFAMEIALEHRGFEAIAASYASKAMNLLCDSTTRYDALITDIRLADGDDGWSLAHQARELVPEIAVVYVTGEGVPDWPRLGVSESVALQKRP